MKNRPALIALALLLVFIGGSVWLIFQYVSAEKQRDLDAWRSRLGIMAESQQHVVQRWFDRQSGNISDLAANPLMQLYVSQLALAGSSEDETSRGQLQHLRNLINATADRAGVFAPVQAIKSNVINTVNDGIAVVNEKGVLLATRYFPVDDAQVARAWQQVVRQAGVYVSPVYESGKKQPRLIIAVPVSPVQAMRASDIRAAVIAVINPERSLYPLLAKDWVSIRTEESLLLLSADNMLAYLSPLKQGFGLFHQRADSNTAEAQAAEKPGSFAMATDYRGVAVLATARRLKNTPMILVQKIDLQEALAESKAHRNFILTVFLLVVFLLAVSFIAIWRHATSLHLERARRRLEARAALLNAVGDSINDHIFLLDHKNRLVFINNALAGTFAISNVDIRGKSLNHVFNNEISERLLKLIPAGREEEVRNREMRLEVKGRRHDYHVSVVALHHPDYRRSHLFVMHDITGLKDAQGRHNRLMQGIIATLVQLIDRHDPHCAHHSERTRDVAVAIARAMGLPQKRIDALSMAALLANIGKLYIPAEMLTNEDALTEEESALVRKNVDHSVEILRDLEFEGPVVEIIRQKNEYLDGSGYPQGLSGDDILQESRILSVANAFVAMTSSRAWRPGKPVKETLDILISEADTRYDRHVIAALFYVAENHGDWFDWQE